MTTSFNHYDAIVVGLGAMGSATLYQLALAGKRVLGIDQYSPPHTLGSSHGDTRITRQAIGEGEKYVPLALRSHELWRDIEKKVNRQLLFPVGGLIIGDLAATPVHPYKTGFIESTIATAKKFDIPHEVLDATQVRRRFPQFAITDNYSGYFESGAGFVKPEECVKAQLELAKSLGAEIVLNQKVIELSPDISAGAVGVKTRDAAYKAEQVILTAGPWINELVERTEPYFKVYRQVLFWFSPKRTIDAFLPDRCPTFIWSFADGGRDGMYGFPAVDGAQGGVKVAAEQYEVSTTPDKVVRDVSVQEIERMYSEYVRDRIPMLSDRCVKAVSCLYTVTPDSDFVIQRHPKFRQVIIASPCSGHGFKHSAAVGETLAQLVVSDRSEIDITGFQFKAS